MQLPPVLFATMLPPILIPVPALSMPPTKVAELLAKVLLLMVSTPRGWLKRPPPPLLAELLAKVLLLMVTVLLNWLKRPPPSAPAELLAKVLLLMLTVPPTLKRPPPAPGDELLAKVLLLMLTVPPMSARPPPLLDKPWAMVRALSVKLTPLFTESTCTLLPPSRVTLCPLPSRVRFLLMVSVLMMGMVPLQLNVIVSPAEALPMTVPMRPGPVSPLQSVTVRVAAGAACACRLTPATTTPRTLSRPSRTTRSRLEGQSIDFPGLMRNHSFLYRLCRLSPEPAARLVGWPRGACSTSAEAVCAPLASSVCCQEIL